MPCLSLRIEPIGPIAEIGISSPRSEGGSGAITWIRALVDTGCTETSLRVTIAKACGLPIVGKGIALTAGGPVAANSYHGDLFLPDMQTGTSDPRAFYDRWYVELVHPHPGFDALVGMDILRKGTLALDGPNGSGTFCW